MSKLAATPRRAVEARRRARSQPVAPIAAGVDRSRSAAGSPAPRASPTGRARASPAAGQPTRSRRAAASHAPPVRSPQTGRPRGRAARSAGRPAPAVGDAQVRSPARCGGAPRGRSEWRDRAAPPRQRRSTPRRNRAGMAACHRLGRSGNRSNSARTRKAPSTHSAGQHAGQNRSHNSAARARRSRVELPAGVRRAIGHRSPRPAHLPVGSASQSGMVSSASNAS